MIVQSFSSHIAAQTNLWKFPHYNSHILICHLIMDKVHESTLPDLTLLAHADMQAKYAYALWIILIDTLAARSKT